MAIIFKGTTGKTIIKRTGGSTFTSKLATGPIVIEALNPASASNLELWLAADSGASSADEAGIVSFWDDISGNGRDFNNLGSVARRPTFRTSQSISGRPGVSFGEGGGSQFMKQSAGSQPDFLHNGSSSTIFAVVKPDTVVGGINKDEVFFDNTEFGTQRGVRLRHRNTAQSEHRVSYFIRSSVTTVIVAETVSGSSILGDTVSLISVTHESGSGLEIFIDGVSRATSSTFFSAYETESSPNTMTLGDIGDSISGVHDYDGDLLEVIQYSDLLSTDDRLGIEKYLTDKYGI